MATHRVRGSFDVEITPAGDALAATGRMSISKQFRGDLAAESRGTMLTAMTDVEGSAGYVAIERVEGTLAGRHGSFLLQHSGILDRGVPELRIVVVPDSGTEELLGLSGRMSIEVTGDHHTYDFEFTIPDAPAPGPSAAPDLPRGNG